MQNPVAAEGERAANLKESERFTVVIGNPPWDREQRARRYRKTQGRCRPLRRRRNPAATRGNGEAHERSQLGLHIKNLYNDYVYFWRWALWQGTELPPGPGVVAFITASSYLDGISMGGVRSLLRKVFDELWIVDLGGEGRGALVEENVFDIRTPVAVAIGVRIGQAPDDERTDQTTPDECTDDTPAEECTVRYLQIAGSRADKLTRLGELGLDDVSEEVAGDGLDGFTPEATAGTTTGPRSSISSPGSAPAASLGRTWPIAENRALLTSRWERVVKAVPRSRSELFVETSTGKKIWSEPKPLLSSGDKLRPYTSGSILGTCQKDSTSTDTGVSTATGSLPITV